ncbi:MAG: CsgG/HfaB family protein [Candidatus Scalindua sp.]
MTDVSEMVRSKWFTKEFDSVNYHKSEEYDNASLQRVLLLPFTIESNRDKVVKDVTEAFSIELQKSAKFDIIEAQEFQDILSQQKDIWTRGLIRAETIVEAKKRYKVDAIIFGTITQYQPYEPPILGIKIGMFSTKSGNIMWSADAIFDSSQASVIKLLKSYHKKQYQRKQSLYEWNLIMLSMKRYAQFAAFHIIATL